MKALFLSDNHYNTYGGRLMVPIFETLFDLTYLEDDYGSFLVDADLEQYDLLITCAIGDTPQAPHAPDEAEPRVRSWMERGLPTLMLHGGSATFWKWDWWREAVGLRWVRSNDPDGFAASRHPVTPYELRRVKTRHRLARELEEWKVPEDELYIGLEETRPLSRLLETSWGGKSYPMAYSCRNQWGGLMLGYLPGHDKTVVDNPANRRNLLRLARFAARGRARRVSAF